jgi:hypothetical protein
MKRTAVEWLVEQLLKKSNIQHINGFDDLVEQAKEMENNRMEQLKDFEKWKEWKNEPQ